MAAEWRGGIKNLVRSSVSQNEWAKYHRAAFPEWLPQWIVTNFTNPVKRSWMDALESGQRSVREKTWDSDRRRTRRKIL